MTGAFEMFEKVLLLSSICTVVQSSGLEHVGQISPIAPIDTAPVVTAASSQYFERTFNRLVVPQVAPVAPVIPAAVQPVIPVAPNPTVLLEPDRRVPVPINPQPNPEAIDQPNVAIAIATAHAAAPVATILLPPYPFGFPPTVRFIPPEQPINTSDENNKEPTTQSTTQAEVTRTTQKPKSTTPIPSNSDDNFVQALPSNEDVNFKQYGVPPQSRPQFQPIPQSQQPRPQPNQPRPEFQPRPQQPFAEFQPNQQQFRPTFSLPPQQPLPQFKSLPQPPQPHLQYQPIMRPQLQPKPQPWPQNVAKTKPQKLKTSVQVVPVPLAYIAPPSAQYRHGHHHHHGRVKVVKHIYSFIPVSKSKIILKELPVRLVAYKTTGNAKANIKDIEFTTFSPFPPRPNTKPPRLW